MKTKKTALVAIVMGSDSDFKTMKEAGKVLKQFDVTYVYRVLSAHRSPQDMLSFAKIAHQEGFKVIIAGAGGAAHLPGMIASHSPLPVIGVPVESRYLKGLDALLSIAQMPKGVPVACMSIANAHNAGLLALSVLGAFNEVIQNKLLKHKAKMRKISLQKDKRIQIRK